MPMGPDGFVVMDTDNPYVGEQTSMVKFSKSEPRGIQQSRLAIRKGQSYTRRIGKGTPGATIEVALLAPALDLSVSEQFL